MSRTVGKKGVADLLASYSPDVRKLVLATRAFVLEVIPGALELVDAKSKVVGYGFGTGYKDMVCSIMPNQKGVTLGIGWGTELPDPQKLLEGAGKVHRHVKVKSESDLEVPALKALLVAALARREKMAAKAKT
ncbi:MAG TPA: hypothetical protein VI488_03570 [Candidatus Angelobacter sp.]